MTTDGLRSDWTFAGVQNAYVKYKSAGDMYVERKVARLSLKNPWFALSPPHLLVSDEVTIGATEVTFLNIPNSLRYIGKLCLASLVYHSRYLDHNLSLEHIVRETVSF